MITKDRSNKRGGGRETGQAAAFGLGAGFLALMVIVPVGGYFSLLWTLRDGNADIRGHIARLERAAERRSTMAEAMGASVAPKDAAPGDTAGGVEADLKHLTMPQADHSQAAAALQARLRELVAASGAQLERLSIEPPEASPGQVTVRLQLMAEELMLADLLARLDRHDPVLRTDRLTITGLSARDATKTGSPPVRVTMHVTAALRPGDSS